MAPPNFLFPFFLTNYILTSNRKRLQNGVRTTLPPSVGAPVDHVAVVAGQKFGKQCVTSRSINGGMNSPITVSRFDIQTSNFAAMNITSCSLRKTPLCTLTLQYFQVESHFK